MIIPRLNIKLLQFEFTRSFTQILASWYRDQVDVLPPYGNYQGALLGKSVENNSYYIDLGEDMVEVDSVTYSLLEVGESIKVRYTRRGKKAINIDRYSDEPSFQGNE